MDSALSYVYNKNRIRRYVSMVLGVFICALTYNLFILPYDIVFGGLGGVNIIVSNFIDVRSSLFLLSASLFLCLVSFIFLSKKNTIRSMVGAVLFPFFVEITSNANKIISFDMSDQLLFAIVAGVLYGIGMGLIMKSGFTLGGTDIITQIISKYCKITMGHAMLFVEGTIVVFGAFIFGITNFMYAVIILYLITFLVDKVMLGISDKKAFYIITKKRKRICDFIINDLGHTVTVFSATGGFSRKKVSVLFTVVPTREYYKVRDGIKSIDSETFFTVVDAYEVTGGE